MKRISILTTLLCFGLAAESLSAAQVTLFPADGALIGAAGQTVGWGFSIFNESNVDFISFTQSLLVNETNPGLGVYQDLIGAQGGPFNFVQQPGEQWDQAFSAVDGTGIGTFSIDPGAVDGASDSGIIRIFFDAYAGDPSTCDCVPASFSVDTPFSVTVQNTPEPGVFWLVCGGGLVLLGRRRVRRA